MSVMISVSGAAAFQIKPQHWKQLDKPSCLQSVSHTNSMNRAAVNSSSSASEYYWAECDSYDDGNGGDGKSRGPSAGLLILLISYGFEFLVGAPLNLWLICHILGKKSKIAGVLPADFFPLYLAFIQLFFCLTFPTFLVNHLLMRSSKVMVLVTILSSMGFVLKPLLLCLVCVERYMAVVRPIDYLRFKAPRYRWGCIGVLFCIYIIMVTSVFIERSSINLCVVFLPVLVIDTFCSLSVLKNLKNPPPGDREVNKEGEEERKTQTTGSEAVRMEEVGRSESRGKAEMNSMKKKAFITIVIIQAVLTLNYLPIIITMPMNGQVPERTLKCQYMTMSLAAAASCSYLQPLLYLHRLGRLTCVTAKKQ